MFKSWRLGRVLGFPVEVNLSFLLLLAFVLIAYGGLTGVFVILLAFGSVLLHELGHAVVARQLGVGVTGIELSFFGGAAKMGNMPRNPNHEIAIAAAGPLVSLVLAGIGLGLGSVLHAPLLGLIGWINLVIAGFNLIPALPMDGGRILRALLAKTMNYIRATDVAVIVARVVTISFAVIGLAFGMYQLLLLSPFLWMMTTQEQRIAHMTDSYRYGDVEVLDHNGWGSPFDPRSRRSADDPFSRSPMQRFRIVHRNGRLVIEALD
jgi:Zn-dependent protease